MTALEIRSLDDGLLDEAAALLAERHAGHRVREPLLPDVTDFRTQIERDLARERAVGVAGLRDGKLVSYLAGRSESRGIYEWGFVDLAGCASSEPESVRDLFTVLADRWHEAGVSRFGALIPAGDEKLIDPWFRLAFGCQFVTGVRETGSRDRVDVDVEIRAGSPADLEPVADFDRILWTLQAGSPSFSGLDVEAENFLREWSDTWDDPDELPHFIAERDGRVVGHLLLYRRPTGDLRVPEQNIDLAHAATLAEVRGSGVGLALTTHALRWAHEHGYRSMTTDWRSVNLLSSRFWTNRGFRPTFLRLYRAVP